MAEKNYVRLDKVSVAAHYETVIPSGKEIIAGTLVDLGAVLAGHREAVSYEEAKEGKGFDAIAVPVYLDYGYVDFDITTQSIKAGKPCRVLHRENGAIISINKELVSGDPAKGDNVTTAANGKGFKKAAGSDVVVGKVIDTEVLTNVGELVAIRLVK